VTLSPVKMHLVVVSLSGRELASCEAAGEWSRHDICARIPNLRGSLARSARFVCGLAVLDGDDTLDDVGVGDAATVTLLLDVHFAFVVLAASDDYSARLWSAETGEEVMALIGHDSPVTGVAMTLDGEFFVTVPSNGIARVWAGGSGECSLTVRAANVSNGIDCVAISPCGTYFAMANMAESAVSLWSLGTGELVRRWPHRDARRVGFSPSGRYSMSVSIDGVHKMWDVSSDDCLRTSDERRLVLDVAFALGGETLLLASLSAPVELINMRSGECLLSLDHDGATAVAVALSPRGDAAITLTSYNVVRSWNAVTGECLCAFEPDAPVRSMCYATCGRERMIAAGTEGGGLSFWGLDSGRLLREARGHTETNRSLVDITRAAL